MNSIVVNKSVEKQYDIIFCGLRNDIDIEKTKRQFGLLFCYTEQQVKKIFSRNRVTLKKNVNEKTAERIVHCLQLMGVQVECERVYVDVKPEHISGESDILPLLIPQTISITHAPVVSSSPQKRAGTIVLPLAEAREKLEKIKALELKLQRIKMAKAKKTAGQVVVGTEPSVYVCCEPEEKIFPVVYYIDQGAESVEACSMHQYVEPVSRPAELQYYWAKWIAIVVGSIIVFAAIAYGCKLLFLK